MGEAKGAERAPERFSGLLLRHRGRSGLTQRQLAARVGVNRRALQDWEAGVNCPTAERLQSLISALLDADGLTSGHEAEEAEELWTAAEREATRTRSPFDHGWFTRLAADQAVSQAAGRPGALPERVVGPPPLGQDLDVALERRQDWGDAPDLLDFVGRDEELATIQDWVVHARCRLVGVLGMGGIGKTSLAARLARDAAPAFRRVYWRSLRNAPPVDEWLAGAIGFLSGQQRVPPPGEAERRAVLVELLRDEPSLLVLDNFETVLEPGHREGRYRDNLGGYGALLRAVGEGRHESCLVVTSREAPPELAVFEGRAVRSLALGGLNVPQGQSLLAHKHLVGNERAWAWLVARYGGNGLALKVVGESIRELFGGDIDSFRDVDEASASGVFGGIRWLLRGQVERGSALEQQLLRVLAVAREPVKIADLAPRAGRGPVLEAVEALRRRSLVERTETPGVAAFTLQSVVLEYVTDRLVADVAEEILFSEPVLLAEQPLIQAQAKDYVRQVQERLIGAPILQQLEAQRGNGGTEQRLLALLEHWRGSSHAEQGYGPGNVVNLLRLLRGDLRGLDLSNLVIRQAYLAEMDSQGANLSGAQLAESVLAEAFHFPPSVALSRDGALLAAGTSTGEVWLWRVADRTSLWVTQGHTGGVWGVVLSADGQLLASGGEDGLVRLWETSAGRPVVTLSGHGGAVWGVALSADGELVASGAADGMVRLWDTGAEHPLATLQGHTGGVWRVALSADGRLVASGGADGTVRLWEVSTGQPLMTLRGHRSAVWGVALSMDGQLLVSAGEDGTVRLWETGSGRPVATLQGHTGTVWGVALSADGRLLVSGGEDGTVRLWEAGTGRPVSTLSGHGGTVWGVALSADGQLLVSGGEDGRVRLWEARTGHPLATLQGYGGGVWRVALSADGRLVASGGADGTLRLWEASTGRWLATLQGHTGMVWGVALSADGYLVASVGGDGTVRLWETGNGRCLLALQGHVGTVSGVALSADGQLVASGGADGTVRLWLTSTGQPLATLHGHTGGVWRVALSADGRLLASGGFDGTIRLWDGSSERPLATLLGHTGAISGIALSAGGQLLASGGEDGTVRLWETSTGRPVATLQGHSSTVWGVAVSADGRLVASGGTDGTVRLWEASSGHPLATLQGHTGGVFGVVLSASGQLLASSGFDGTVRLWDAKTGTHLRTLRAERRYERLDITGLTGVTSAQRAALLALGAVEHGNLAE